MITISLIIVFLSSLAIGVIYFALWPLTLQLKSLFCMLLRVSRPGHNPCSHKWLMIEILFRSKKYEFYICLVGAQWVEWEERWEESALECDPGDCTQMLSPFLAISEVTFPLSSINPLSLKPLQNLLHRFQSWSFNSPFFRMLLESFLNFIFNNIVGIFLNGPEISLIKCSVHYWHQ